MRPLLLALAGLSLGCRPTIEPLEPFDYVCDARQLELGEVRVRRIPCGDEVIEDGDATRGHWMLENAFLRVGIRDQGVSLTRLGRAGGTIVDFSRSGTDDFVLEATPLIGPEQDWFVEAEVIPFEEEGLAGIEVRGTMPSGREDAMRYLLRADAGTVELEDVDGIEFSTERYGGRIGETMASPSDANLLFATDGRLDEDRGGWVRWTDVQNIALAAASELHGLLPRRWAIQYRGVASGDYVEAWSSGELVHRVRTAGDNDQPFVIWVPPTVDRLRATKVDSAPGDFETPRDNVRLDVGRKGVLAVEIQDTDGENVPAAVWWNGVRWYFSTGYGSIYGVPGLGSGLVSAGPQYELATVPELDVYDEVFAAAVVEKAMEDPPLLAALGVTSWPGSTSRTDTASIVASAAAAGVQVVVAVADDEVARASVSSANERRSVALAGSRAATAEAGRPYAFPWTANSREAAHGAAPWAELDAVDLLAAMSPLGQRCTVVDPDWVAAAGDPDTWDPQPDALQIASLDELPTYTALLDRWRQPALLGPLTWLDGTSPDSFSEDDAVAAIFEARTVATTGPLITLRVENALPGGNVADEPLRRTLLRVEAPRWIPLTHAALIGPDGELARWELPDDTSQRLEVELSLDPELDWVLATAWGEELNPPLVETPAWAATSAIFLGRP
jgi:hypothetical protein